MDPSWCHRLELTPFARAEFQEAYSPTDDQIERARRTVIRSFMGFGSDGVHSTHRTGFRAKSQRSGTTPAHDWRNYPEALRTIVDRFRGVVIEHEPALKVIERFDGDGVVFYVDPPYVHSTRQRVDAARGYRHEMTDADHEALAEMLNRVQGAVVLSGYPCDLYDRLFASWQRVEKTGPLADGARERTEVLWLRNVEPDLFSYAPSKRSYRTATGSSCWPSRSTARETTGSSTFPTRNAPTRSTP